MSKIVAKVNELWNQKATQFKTEEEMDNFFNNYNNISIGLVLDQTDLITFSYTIKVPGESIPEDYPMYEENQGVETNVLLIFNFSFITNVLSPVPWLRKLRFTLMLFLLLLFANNFPNFPEILQNTWKSLSKSILILTPVRLQDLIKILRGTMGPIFCSVTVDSTMSYFL